jgi:hypothetical protein
MGINQTSVVKLIQGFILPTSLIEGRRVENLIQGFAAMGSPGLADGRAVVPCCDRPTIICGNKFADFRPLISKRFFARDREGHGRPCRGADDRDDREIDEGRPHPERRFSRPVCSVQSGADLEGRVEWRLCCAPEALEAGFGRDLAQSAQQAKRYVDSTPTHRALAFLSRSGRAEIFSSANLLSRLGSGPQPGHAKACQGLASVGSRLPVRTQARTAQR